MSLDRQVFCGSDSELIIKKSKSPLPMQYMGGKGRIVHEILDGIESRFNDTSNFVDLFAGSGVVSFQAMQRGFQVSANDIQPYSSMVLSSLLIYSPHGIEELIENLNRVTEEQLFCNSRSRYASDYLKEKEFFSSLDKGLFDWEQYKIFSDSTDLCSGSEYDVNILKKSECWTLFLAYYRNTYFGVRQCAEIDYLRELSETLDDDLKGHLIASVISSLTYCVSSTTHLAQFLKPSTEKNSKNLLKRRRLNVIDFVVERLSSLQGADRSNVGTVLNLDFREALKHLKLNASTVVYADPPYFKEHYSRYYHVLDTFVLYDYPVLTFNSRLGTITKGRYRDNRLVSDFGKKSLVKAAFDELCNSCIKYGNKLAISYACSSLVEKDFFFQIAKDKELNLEVLEFDLLHTGQGQARHKSVKEFVFLYSNE